MIPIAWQHPPRSLRTILDGYIISMQAVAGLARQHGRPNKPVTFHHFHTSIYVAICERVTHLQVSGRYFIRTDLNPPEATH
jgi:hypothetical protein